jgi:hypothetical protein
MTTEADRELAEETAREFTNRLFWAQSSQAKYAMILDDLGRVIYNAFAKRDALKAEKLEAEAFQRKLDNEP